VIARDDQRAGFERNLEEARKLEPSIHEVSVDEAIALLPVLRRDYVSAAHLEPGSMYMDVDLIHGGFLRDFKKAGGHLACDAEARGISRDGGQWTIETPAGDFQAPVLINAAGAWADTVARRAGVAPIGLQPKRRTVIIFDDPEAPPIDASPMAIDVDEEFYFKPEAGKILASPADETPSEPCDAQPEELDIALAVDRIERATTLKARRIEHKWAGLRSFAADRSPVVGFAEGVEGGARFLWLAGQGGYGIMTSPAMGRVAASLAAGEEWPEDLSGLGVTASDLSPSRSSLKRD
jgi:D-arginine dehydrogenase